MPYYSIISGCDFIISAVDYKIATTDYVIAATDYKIIWHLSKHPPRYIILIQISRILGYNFACKDYMYKSSKGCRLNQATTHPTNFHN